MKPKPFQTRFAPPIVRQVPDYQLFQAGQMALQRGQRLNAMVYWGKLVEKQPKRFAVRFKLGQLMAQEGYKAEAREHFMAILKSRPTHAGARKALRELSANP